MGTGNILVDNFIRITVTRGNTEVSGPANICRGGTTETSPSGVQNNCFNATYLNAGPGLVGQDMKHLFRNRGRSPIDVSNLQLRQTSAGHSYQEATEMEVDRAVIAGKAEFQFIALPWLRAHPSFQVAPAPIRTQVFVTNGVCEVFQHE